MSNSTRPFSLGEYSVEHPLAVRLTTLTPEDRAAQEREIEDDYARRDAGVTDPERNRVIRRAIGNGLEVLMSAEGDRLSEAKPAVEWDRIDALAARCDVLPLVASTAPPVVVGGNATKPTIYYHGCRGYSIDGATPVGVSRSEHNVLMAFLKHGTAMTGTKLEACGTANAAVTMMRLASSYGGRFAAAIVRPGRKGGGGYFIRVQPAPATGDNLLPS